MQGEGVLNQLAASEDGASSGQALVAHVQRFSVRGDDKVHLVPCRKLVVSSNANIEIRRASGEEEARFASAVLDKSLLVSDFSQLQRAVPHLCNIIGFVRNVGEMYESSKGIPMREFELIGRGALFVKCLAFGAHAMAGEIVEKSEVAMYFVQASAGLKGESGRLWLYDDAQVVQLRVNAPMLFGSREEEVRLA